MSINWVMLSESEGFTPLPGEQRLYTSPPRTALSLSSVNKYPGKEPFAVSSSGGCVHLTNRRIVYLPSSPTPQLQSFAAPLLHLHDSHVSAPFFGPNVCTAIVQPVPGGGVPPHIQAIELKMTFKDGGAFDYQTKLERIRERLVQAVSVVRDGAARDDENGTVHGSGGGAGAGGELSGVNLDNVHLDELPAYSERGQAVPVQASAPLPLEAEAQRPEIHAPTAIRSSGGQASATSHSTPASSPQQEVFTPPDEPPPGYEEVQRGSIADELERRVRSGELTRDGD